MFNSIDERFELQKLTWFDGREITLMTKDWWEARGFEFEPVLGGSLLL
jgi:hypothetical protein